MLDRIKVSSALSSRISTLKRLSVARPTQNQKAPTRRSAFDCLGSIEPSTSDRLSVAHSTQKQAANACRLAFEWLGSTEPYTGGCSRGLTNQRVQKEKSSNGEIHCFVPSCIKRKSTLDITTKGLLKAKS